MKTQEEIETKLSEITEIKNDLQKHYYERLSKQSSIYEGVCFHKVSKRWKSRVNVDGKRLHIGSFKTEQEAYMARKNYIDSNIGISTHLSPG